MRWKHTTTPALLLTAATLATSCGGTDSNEPTQAAFARQADKACQRHNQQTQALFKQALALKKQGIPLTQIKTRLADKPATYTAQEHTTLTNIQPPNNLKTKYTQWLTAITKRNNPNQPPPTHQQAITTHKLATNLGFKTCQ